MSLKIRFSRRPSKLLHHKKLQVDSALHSDTCAAPATHALPITASIPKLLVQLTCQSLFRRLPALRSSPRETPTSNSSAGPASSDRPALRFQVTNPVPPAKSTRPPQAAAAEAPLDPRDYRACVSVLSRPYEFRRATACKVHPASTSPSLPERELAQLVILLQTQDGLSPERPVHHSLSQKGTAPTPARKHPTPRLHSAPTAPTVGFTGKARRAISSIAASCTEFPNTASGLITPAN